MQGDVALVEPSDRSKRGATSRSYLLWPGAVVHFTISSRYTRECIVACVGVRLVSRGPDPSRGGAGGGEEGRRVW